MNPVSISYKSKTNLIDELLKQENIKTLEEKKGLLSKFMSSTKEYSDIYFHSGTIDDKAIESAQNAKFVLVNSATLKEELLSKANIDSSKVEVIYPSINIDYEKPKTVKQRVCENLEINPKKRIILFTANNIKASGVKEFIETLFSLNEQNFIGIIAGDSKQIYNLKFQLSKFSYSEKLLLVEDYEDINELYLAADIFLLPTYNKSFATSVLKAMYCKCAVFTTVNNHAKELVDVFSTMESPTDRSAPFKVDALLMQKEELKKIQKQNRKIAKKFTLEKNLQKVNEIIQAV